MLPPFSMVLTAVPVEFDGVVTTDDSQASKPPPTKSLRTASTDVDERVSARKLAKHSSSRSRKPRSMPPSKKWPIGNLLAGEPAALAWNGHGESTSAVLTVAQHGSPFGTDGGPTQSAVWVVVPAIRSSVPLIAPLPVMSPPGPFHWNTRMVTLPPPLVKSLSTRMSPSVWSPGPNDPPASAVTSSWKNQKPMTASPLFE